MTVSNNSDKFCSILREQFYNIGIELASFYCDVETYLPWCQGFPVFDFVKKKKRKPPGGYILKSKKTPSWLKLLS